MISDPKIDSPIEYGGISANDDPSSIDETVPVYSTSSFSAPAPNGRQNSAATIVFPIGPSLWNPTVSDARRMPRVAGFGGVSGNQGFRGFARATATARRR